MRLLLAACLAAMHLGCSFVFVRGPSSSTPPTMYPSCDESRLMPGLDIAFATAYVGMSVLAATQVEDDSSMNGNQGTELLRGSLMGAALFGASAWFGFSRTGSCIERRQEYRARYGDPYQRPAWPPPGTPMLPPAPAGEGQACHPQLGCAPGLVCASGLCVRPPTIAPQAPGAAP